MEDDEMVRNVAGQLLDHLGYEVHLARDGAEAIELFLQARGEELPFDLVVLDLIVRGGMGGKETIRALHQIDPAVKAIAKAAMLTIRPWPILPNTDFEAPLPNHFRLKR